jgi:hypothetical protein
MLRCGLHDDYFFPNNFDGYFCFLVCQVEFLAKNLKILGENTVSKIFVDFEIHVLAGTSTNH